MRRRHARGLMTLIRRINTYRGQPAGAFESHITFHDGAPPMLRPELGFYHWRLIRRSATYSVSSIAFTPLYHISGYYFDAFPACNYENTHFLAANADARLLSDVKATSDMYHWPTAHGPSRSLADVISKLRRL